MSSKTLNGYRNSCGKIMGGIKSLALIEKCKVERFIFDSTSQTYTGVVLKPNQTFAVYTLAEGEVQYVETLTREGEKRSVTHSIEFTICKIDEYSLKAIDEIKAAALCGIIAVVTTNEDISFVVGYSEEMLGERALKLVGCETLSGKKFADKPSQKVTLSSCDISKSKIFKGDL